MVLADTNAAKEAETKGFVEFEDFILERYLEKKIVVIYGNCHTTIIGEYIEKCSSFQERYALYRIDPIQTIDDPSYFERPIFRHCDVFVHQSIRLGNRYGDEYASERIISRLKKDCEVIAIPNVYHLPICFFPQYSEAAEFKKRNGATLFFRDAILDACAARGMSIRQAQGDYTNGQHYADKDIQSGLQKFLEKVELREQDWDIKCSQFIRENYKHTQLFYDPNHPTNFFLRYIAASLLRLLGIHCSKEELESAEIVALTAYEMPILPEVRRSLGLLFPDNQELRRDGVKLEKRAMRVFEYVSEYLSCEWQNPEAPSIYKMKMFAIYARYRLIAFVNRLVNRFKNLVYANQS